MLGAPIFKKKFDQKAVVEMFDCGDETSTSQRLFSDKMESTLNNRVSYTPLGRMRGCIRIERNQSRSHAMPDTREDDSDHRSSEHTPTTRNMMIISSN